MASPGSDLPAQADPAQLRCGIEAEYGLAHPERGLLDFVNSSFPEFQRVVDRLPDHGDADLTRGDLAIKYTRWYVEGDERFAPDGRFLRCVPKGVETRTPVRVGIEATAAALVEQTRALMVAAAADGCRLVAIGHNPWRGPYRPDPPYLATEAALHAEHPEYAAPDVYMRTYGPDFNLSHPAWDDAATVDIGRKLCAYAPEMAAFSANAPFAAGRRWPGYSARIHARAGRRPAVRLFLADPAVAPAGLARPARIPAERGRVEFKAFDALPELAAYPALLALVAGVALAPELPARADTADPRRLRLAAIRAFDDPDLRADATGVLSAATGALVGTRWVDLLGPLWEAVGTGTTPAHSLIAAHTGGAGITAPPVTLPD
jgi:Glutamate-cysteine ligase family 2(GCS2)